MYMYKSDTKFVFKGVKLVYLVFILITYFCVLAVCVWKKKTFFQEEEKKILEKDVAAPTTSVRRHSTC